MDVMFTFLILTLGICQIQAHSLIHNSTGTLDEHGVCLCSVVLPDSTFPADRMEMLEISNHNLTITVEQEITKIHNSLSVLTVYIEKLKNVTIRVEEMEKGHVSYTELEFELLKLEIKEMETIILQLQSSFNGTNVLVETLYLEIHNISIIVNQLEGYDKNNVLAIRKEILALQKRLEDCQNNHTKPNPNPNLPPGVLGSCDHGTIADVSKPFVVQLNWLGFGYKYGGWGRDSLVGVNQSVQWVSPLLTDARQMYKLQLYSSYNNLLLYTPSLDRSFSGSTLGQGGGMIMFNHTMYYNFYNTRDLCKYNPQTNTAERRTLPDASYNNRFSYLSSAWQDIDLAADEYGLWVIYATEASLGNIVISTLDPISLLVKKTWHTSQYKRGATNAFMSCGVLYVTRALNFKQEVIFYMFDTKTGKEGYLSIILEKVMENVQSLSYNPNDHKLYMYNDGYLITYDINFKSLQGKKK